jgi:hypothetical protein
MTVPHDEKTLNEVNGIYVYYAVNEIYESEIYVYVVVIYHDDDDE